MFWTAALYLDRWILYAAMLAASGSALFIVWRRSQTATAMRVGSWAAMTAALAYVFAIGFEGADLMEIAPFSASAWIMGARTTLLQSAAVGVLAMALLLIYFRRPAHRWLAAIAIVFAIVSFIVTGHAASAHPRWLMILATATHLGAAAFWIGALWPLRTALRDEPPADAAALCGMFSRRAVYGVALLIASGAVLSWIQLGRIDAFFTSTYGLVLAVKIAMVCVLLVLAWINKAVLTPSLQRSEKASVLLRRSIMAEVVLFAIILAVAVALTAAAPPGME